ncbi:LysR family transcriptional regulator [Paucilactobacillus vaccinostercus]|nr:LysR family transcriptional regulator [Paucilactobacillus vaccinostercus]
MFNISDYILTIVAQGTFSQAAKQLHISQPALSIAVKKLETQIGQPLFDRGQTPLALTTAGELYVAKARQVVALEESLTDDLTHLEHRLTGNLTIGGAFISVTYLLPPLLRRFHEQFPNVQLTVLEAPFPDLPRLLRDRQIDLAVDTDLVLNPQINSVKLFENHVLLAVPDHLITDVTILTKGYQYADILADQHIQAPQRVALATFAQLPFVLMTPSNEIAQRTAPLFTAANFKPTTAMIVNQQISAYEFARRNWGAAFVTDTLIKHSTPVTGMHFYRIESVEQPRYVAASYYKQDYQSQRLQKFIAVAQQFYH